MEDIKSKIEDLAVQLEDHLRTTTSTTTTTTTYPSLKFEKIGPFKLTRNNKIGEIDTYYKNFEFSMEINYAQTTGSRQLILVGPHSTANNHDPLIFLYFDEGPNKMYIHFWRDGADFQPYVPTNVSKSEFFKWNKKGVRCPRKLPVSVGIYTITQVIDFELLETSNKASTHSINK